MTNEEYETNCCTIISTAGIARSLYIESIDEAKKNNVIKARELIEKGDEKYNLSHECHFKIIQSESKGELDRIGLLLIHAEDILMSAEELKIMSNEFLELYCKLNEETK